MKAETPAEPFKRAVATAVRSIAGEPELEVSYSSEPPGLKGLKARLPSPTRNLSARDIALVRGTGDAYALRKAYHDEKINARFRPADADNAALFDAAEQARVALMMMPFGNLHHGPPSTSTAPNSFLASS